MRDPIPLLRIIGLMEAVSFLLLLAVAMPLKYFAGMPWTVKIAGAVHGGLFVFLSILILRTVWVAKWRISRGLLVWIAALLPFGPFLLDQRLRAYSREFQARHNGSSLNLFTPSDGALVDTQGLSRHSTSD